MEKDKSKVSQKPLIWPRPAQAHPSDSGSVGAIHPSRGLAASIERAIDLLWAAWRTPSEVIAIIQTVFLFFERIKPHLTLRM